MKRRRFVKTSAAAAALIRTTSASAQGGLELPASYSNWDGLTPLGAPGLGGDRWGVPELWWYGRAKGFSYGADVVIRSEDATSFWMKGRAQAQKDTGLFGVAIQWGRPLGTGYAYKFVLRMQPADCLPDLITVNDCVVWRKSKGYANAAAYEVECVYVPASPEETATLRLMRECGSQWFTLHPPHQNSWNPRNFICQRGAYNGPRPAYEKAFVPEGAQLHAIDSHLACTAFHDSLFQPTEYERPGLPKLPYPTADVKIVERGISPIEGGKYLRTGIADVLAYLPSSSYGSEPGFELWAKAAAEAGFREILVSPVLELRNCGYPKAQPGKHQFFHWHSLMRGSTPVMPSMPKWSPAERKARIAEAVKETCRLIQRWFELVPGGRAMMFELEVNGAYGNYGGGIADAAIGEIPGYESVSKGGIPAWRLTFEYFQELRRQCESALGAQRDRFKIMANLDRAAFQGAYCYHSGVDIVLHKNIHRQSVNVVVANSRGAAAAYGKQFGYDFDAWDRNYWGSYPLREIGQGLLVYFHSGAGYLMDEIPVWSRRDRFLSEYGKMWLDFCRYAKTHPRLGSQKVRIAVMRAMGDEWNRVAGPSASWEAGEWLPKTEMARALREPSVSARWAKAKLAQEQGRTPKTEDTYLWDYALLNLVFAKFGSPWRTNPDRLYTGTPYGPVDFIPWDTPAEKLSQYRVIIFLGNGAIDGQTTGNLKQFVEAGGNLMIAAGQLRGADGELVTREFAGVQLGATRKSNGLPYTHLEPAGAATVSDRLANNDPMVVRTGRGKGKLFLFSGECLTYWDDSAPTRIAQGLLETVKWIAFAPASDWLEYSVSKKQKMWVFAIFNHGRGFSPSGNGRDYGPWKGEVALDLPALDLKPQDGIAVYRVAHAREAALPFSLVPIPSSLNGMRLSFSATIAEFEEIVIGPKDHAQQDFFG